MRLLLSAILLTCMFAGWAQKTTRGKLRLRDDVRIENQVVAVDTVIPEKGSVPVSGYEKAQHSTSECFFVTNNSAREISSLTFTVTYFNLRGEILHSRTESVSCDIPPSTTRKIDIRAWDRQKLWYYVNSQARHNDHSTPFDISIHIDHFLSPCE